MKTRSCAIAMLGCFATLGYAQIPPFAVPGEYVASGESPDNSPIDCPAFDLVSGTYIPAERKDQVIYHVDSHRLDIEPVDGYCATGKAVVETFPGFMGQPPPAPAVHEPVRRCPAAQFANRLVGDFLCKRYKAETDQTIGDLKDLSVRLDSLGAPPAPNHH